VVQWWACDPATMARYRYREFYATSTLPSALGAEIKKFTEWRRAEIYTDHDRTDRETLAELGIDTEPANKDVRGGISVAYRLGTEGKIFLLKNARYHPADQQLQSKKLPTCTEEEIGGYIYKDESPLKKNDHGCDALRYMAASWDPPEPMPEAPAKTKHPRQTTAGIREERF
jgi:phage terminase large subunit